MGLRKRKPTSPARRFQTVSDFAEITRTSPEKSLVTQKTRTGGRNNKGRKTARHKGGGHKQQYRLVDFRRTKDGVPAKVAAIEYDPNRTCRIALLHYLDGEKRYCIANNFPTADSYCAQNYADCQKSEEKNTCKDVLWNYCADENWNLTSKPQCGTALVSRYRLQKLNSSILRNAVTGWCAANKNDPQCGY